MKMIQKMLISLIACSAFGGLGLVACRSAPTPAPMEVTTDSVSFAPGCTAQTAAAIISKLVQAGNTNDATALKQVLPLVLVTYGVGWQDQRDVSGLCVGMAAGDSQCGRNMESGLTFFTTSLRDDLVEYFARRGKVQERLTLTHLTVHQIEANRLDFEFTGVVRAADLARGAENVEGKGALHCVPAEIFAWNMAVGVY